MYISSLRQSHDETRRVILTYGVPPLFRLSLETDELRRAGRAAEARVFPLRLEIRHDRPTNRVADPRLIAQVDLNLKHMLTGGQ
jgi:hypothetical protein